jgi:hypothetical protein
LPTINAAITKGVRKLTKEQLKTLIQLMSTSSSTFTLHRETIAELEKLNLSPEQLVAGAKGFPFAKTKFQSKDIVKEVLDILERIRR